MSDRSNRRVIVAGAVFALTLVCLPAVWAQGRGQRGAPSPTANLPFDAHDLTGIWRFSGPLAPPNVPPMTPAGKARFDANIPGLGGPEGKNKPLGNDPMMFCDPLGYPRVLTLRAYPMEMVQLPGRIGQFFDVYCV